MKKIIFLLMAALLSNCTSVQKKQQASVHIEILYSESADIFDLMDNVADWWPGFTTSEYQKFWSDKFSIAKEEKELFKTYRDFRWRYYNDPDQKEKDPLKNRNGLFATVGSITADPVAEAFYSSNTLEKSFEKLDRIVSNKDIVFLKDFYGHFKPKYSQLIANSREDYRVGIQKVRLSLGKAGIAEYFNKVSRFYNVSIPLKYRVIYTWWPPINRTNASPTGKYLVMRYNPQKHEKMMTAMLWHMKSSMLFQPIKVWHRKKN